jgi:2-dehydro-3-deoxygluconokinase
VNTSFVQRDPLLHTALSVLIIGKDGEHTGFLERGASSHLRLKGINSLKKTKWFYISSLTGESEKILPHIFDFAEKHSIKIAFNPGSQQLTEGWSGLKGYLKRTEILFLNVEEAEKLAHSKTGKIPKTERELLGIAANFGSTVTVITEGEVGSHALFEGHNFHQGSVPKDVIDTTGAGDSFGATFLYAVIKGYDLKYALKIAAINSASVVSAMGSTTGLLTYDKIKKSPWL